MRTKMIAGNWKMNKNIIEAVDLASRIKKFLKNVKETEIVICPPFVALSEVAKIIKGTNISLGAQNMHEEEAGAFTGEVSADMLKGLCKFVIIGHSERRQHFNETDKNVNKKIKLALTKGLRPIVCVGETLEQRNERKTEDVIEKQVIKGLDGLGKLDMMKITIAYEPVWAIGTGKTAMPEQAQMVHSTIRKILIKLFGIDVASKVRILYGGSVKPENAKELMQADNIDGALVGGASLSADDFAKIVKACD